MTTVSGESRNSSNSEELSFNMYPRSANETDAEYSERLARMHANAEKYLADQRSVVGQRGEKAKRYAESDQGKAESQIEAKFDAMQTKLDRAVNEGKITRNHADHILEQMLDKIDREIDGLRQDYDDRQTSFGTPEESAKYEAWLESRDDANLANLNRTGRPTDGYDEPSRPTPIPSGKEQEPQGNIPEWLDSFLKERDSSSQPDIVLPDDASPDLSEQLDNDDSESFDHEKSYQEIPSVKLEQGYTFSLDTNFRVPFQLAADDATGYYGQTEWTKPARYAMKHDNIAAIIHVADQPLWLIDVRDDEHFSRKGVPYLVVQPQTTNSGQHSAQNDFMIEIPINSNIRLGRARDYGKHFEFSKVVSNDHCRISCSRSGDEVWLRDAPSLNGTSIKANGELFETPDQGGDGKWVYTESVINDKGLIKRDGQLFIRLHNHEYPYIHRDATSFNGGVDSNLSGQLDIIIDGDSYPIQEMYDDLKQQCDPSWPTLDKLLLVSQTVNDALIEHNDTQVERSYGEPLPPNEKVMMLSDYVRARSGVCRQRALLSACLLEKMCDDNLLSGIIHVERDMKDGYREGHEWATFQETPRSDVYVIDPMQNYVGKKKDATDRNWGYFRP